MSGKGWLGDKSKKVVAIIKWFFYQTLLEYDGWKLSLGKTRFWQSTAQKGWFLVEAFIFRSSAFFPVAGDVFFPVEQFSGKDH
jgi:hypothetical protein